MKIIRPNERPVSWNAYYAGRHWGNRIREKEYIQELFLAEKGRRKRMGLPPYDKKVQITIRAYFKDRPIDPDNIMDKMMIDALKPWLIKDDTMEYIDSVTTQARIDKENPRIEIIVEEV